MLIGAKDSDVAYDLVPDDRLGYHRPPTVEANGGVAIELVSEIKCFADAPAEGLVVSAGQQAVPG
jgi:hypothetical protein